ncbi:MAG: HPr family phosphocarrier protein [Ponticaulis sp.]|nr:HPr family phosphocarrier protein [Ponticaulis sp.]
MKVQNVVTICNERGLHARASAAFARLAQTHNADIIVERAGVEADGKSIMDLLMLAASKGCEIEISATGPDAEPAISELSELVENRFGEDR